MTTTTHPAYTFCGKPAFPILGTRHPDSINWGNVTRDPFAYTERHRKDEPAKQEKVSVRARKPTLQQQALYRIPAKRSTIEKTMKTNSKSLNSNTGSGQNSFL